MKILLGTGKLLILILFTIGLCIGCRDSIKVSSFFGNYKYTDFVAPNEIIEEKRIEDFSKTVFNKLVLLEESCTVGF